MGMRIWYQSSTAIGRNPVFKPYEEAIARNARAVMRPDTEVDVRGVDRMSPHYERSKYARYLNGISIARNAAEAEARGYDAVAVGCYTDPCLEEVRDTVAIPALYMMQTSMHVACMLGARFAFVSYSPANLRQMRVLAQRYGLEQRLAATGCFEAQLSRSNEWFSDPGPIVDRFEKEAARCVSQGAEVLIPTCGVLNQVLRENGVRQVDGCPVLDGSSVLLKLTEAAVDLRRTTGMAWSRGGMSAAALAEIDLAYGVTEPR
jgi:Asp/Glu/hydantoin racemase